MTADTVVDGDRLQADLEANAEFGKIETDEGRGRTVLTGTEANRLARDRLVDRLEDAEMDVRIDAVGNTLGVWTPPSADPDAAPVVAGSHLDSVPSGGIFDGPLGVYGALEAVRSLQDRGVEPDCPIGVASFTEEEGTRFGGGMLGSAVATGVIDAETALSYTEDDGETNEAEGGNLANDDRVTLEEALDAIGYRGTDAIDPGGWNSFLELHVEQDVRLEAAGVPVGIVHTITGIAQAAVRFDGEANHAGATAMDTRRDALVAASAFVLAVEEAGSTVARAGENTAVATVGSIAVEPNATNVVPGRVDLGVDVRDVDRAAMERIFEELQTALDRIESDRAVETAFERTLDVDPAPTSERCRDAFAAAASARDIQTTVLHSGAAHDAMHVSRVTDAGMCFVPSRDGISHSPREWTDWADCAAGASVLAGAIEELSTGPVDGA